MTLTSEPCEIIEHFKELLKKEDPVRVYRKYLLGHNVWYFREHLKKHSHAELYDDLKIYMSEKLDIHVNNIAIVGSAKLGFSLTPTKEKKFQPFSNDSDIDIAIVSSKLFRLSWDAYLDLHRKGYASKIHIVKSDVFRRFVNLKKADYRNDFFNQWNRKVEPCKKDLQTIFSIAHDINYRIYESWEAVQFYHCYGIEKLQKLLGDSGGKSN